MAHTLNHPAPTTLPVPAVEPLIARAATMLAGFVAWRAQARSRRDVAALSPEQLADTAIDPHAVLPARPILEVEAGLMAKLMSMR